MKRYKFFYSPQIPTVDPDEEIIEFEDDITEKEIQEAFTDWVFNKLDTGYWEVDENGDSL